jgi:hypothetical protein
MIRLIRGIDRRNFVPGAKRAIWRDDEYGDGSRSTAPATHAAPFLDNAAQPTVVTPVRSDSGKFNPHRPRVEARVEVALFQKGAETLKPIIAGRRAALMPCG